MCGCIFLLLNMTKFAIMGEKEGIFMQKTRKLSAFLLVAALLICALVGCQAAPDPISEEPAPTTVPTTTVPTTTAPPRYLNLLTGEQNLTTPQNRPVAFMIGNYGYSSTIQQKNIDKADFYMEAETEAGIPRIMAVFGSVESVPQQVGPCRSARTHFVKMAKALDTIYCHIGGSTQGKQLLNTLRVTHLDSLVQVSNELRAVNGAIEHTKVFTRDKIDAAIRSRGIATTTKTTSPYTFGTKAGDGLGNKVQVAISSAYATSFTYDATTGLYTKHRSTLSSPVHTSYDKDPIQVKNVIVMYDNKYQEDEGHISFTLSSGSGILVTGGTSRQIRWSRTNDRLAFTETDGSPLTVAVGKTYVCLTANGNASRTILQ